MTLATKHPSDETLVRRVLRGEPGSFEALVRRHAGLVFSIARSRLHDQESAEDLLQEVFLRVHLNLARLRDATRLAPWLARLTRNLASDWNQRGQRRSQLVPMVPMDEETADVPDTQMKGAREIMESEERAAAVREAIDRLPPDLGEVVWLHCIEGMTQIEISRRIGVRQSTVNRRLHRAFAAMRDWVSSEMRETAPQLHVPDHVVVRSVALIAAASALQGTARASLVAAAAASAPSAKIGSLGPVSILAAKLAAGGALMGTGKGVVAVSAVAAIGFIGYQQIKSPSEARPTEPPPHADQTALIEEARRIEITEPLQLNLAPLPGDHWRQTTSVRGSGIERDLSNPDLPFDMEIRIVSEASVSAGEEAGFVHIDHTIHEAMFHIVPQGAIPDEVRAQSVQNSRVIEAGMMQTVIRETLDAQGRRVQLTIEEPSGGLPRWRSSHGLAYAPLMLGLLSAPAGASEQPLPAGGRWQHRHPLPFLRGVPMTTTCTLEHLEEVNGERVALIRGETECHFAAPEGRALELGVEEDPQIGATVRCLLRRFDLTLGEEARHSLDDGRRVLATRRVEFEVDCLNAFSRAGQVIQSLPKITLIRCEALMELERVS
jgi:RNA polymerase sigma-70 factor (ECF subfamily)